MHRLLVLVAVAACGRIAFEPTSDAPRGSDGTSTSAPPISLELPPGGQFQRIAVALDGTWYALARNGALFRSDDRMSWTPCAPRRSQSVYVEPSGSVWATGATLVNSTDRCASWTTSYTARYSTEVAQLAGQLFAATDIGLIELVDGAGWTTVPTPHDGNPFWSLAKHGGVYLAGTELGVLRSTDGATWTAIGAGVPAGRVRDLGGGATRAYAISAGPPGGIGCTTDGATTWTPCMAASPLPPRSASSSATRHARAGNLPASTAAS